MNNFQKSKLSSWNDSAIVTDAVMVDGNAIDTGCSFADVKAAVRIWSTCSLSNLVTLLARSN